MNFTRKQYAALLITLYAIPALLSACSGKDDILIAPRPSDPPPRKFSITICENVFNAFLYGEIPDSELVYIDTEKHIALQQTDIIIDQGEESSFWVMTTISDLVPGHNYNMRYEIHKGEQELFRSESFTFSSETSEYRGFIVEELNPQGRKKITAGSWTVKIYVNNSLLGTKNVSVLSSTPGEDVAVKEYRWKDFHFQYPGYCLIEEDRDIVTEEGKQFRLIKLTVSSKNRIGLFLYLDDAWIPPTDELSSQSPGMTNMMLGLPIALKHAEPSGAEAVNLSVGSIELADGFKLATRFIIIKPEANTFSSLECFHRSVADKMFFGILFTQGFRGKGSDTPEYFRFIEDTYAIIRSISFPELVSDAGKQLQ